MQILKIFYQKKFIRGVYNEWHFVQSENSFFSLHLFSSNSFFLLL